MRKRKPLLKLAMLLLATMLATGLPPQAEAQQNSSETTRTVTIGYVNWTEAVAVTHLMQAVLEKNFPVKVKLELVDAEEAFRGVANGQLDAFLDVWLPDTHGTYWQKYKDQVVDLGPWYQGTATLGIAVPAYVDAQSIDDLAAQAERYGHKIVGIQKGAGIMRIVRDQVMPAYKLSDFTLTSGSPDDMIEDIDEAIKNRQAIAFTAWTPHWLFRAYPLRILDDPKGVFTQSDRLHAIARKGLKADAPRVWAVLNSFQLTEAQLTELELTVANARSAWGGAHRWLSRHEKVVAPWVIAASPKRSDYLY